MVASFYLCCIFSASGRVVGLGLDWWECPFCKRLVYIGPVRVSADQELEVVDVSELRAGAQS